MYKLTFEVRDNELDAQGVVNNSNYMNYFAHTRHKYLDSIGVNFYEMATQNQMLYLIKSEIEYKKPLLANQIFDVTCKMYQDGIKLVFEQNIVIENEILVKSKNYGVCMDKNRNRPYIPELIKNILKNE